jgi:hypothetical protein
MRRSLVAVVLLFVVAAAFLIYGMIITPWMDSGVSEQGYRRPIQDQPAQQETPTKPPLTDSNVPPASEQNKK